MRPPRNPVRFIKPVDVGLELELHLVIVSERCGDGLGGHAQPRQPGRHVQGEDRLEDEFAIDSFRITVGRHDTVPAREVVDRERGFDLPLEVAQHTAGRS